MGSIGLVKAKGISLEGMWVIRHQKRVRVFNIILDYEEMEMGLTTVDGSPFIITMITKTFIASHNHLLRG